jgi:RNA polymerase sigma-70 factor (ECF subfamily)
MAARITRGKKKIRAARIPFRLPQPADLAQRLDAVLSVIHLFFTAGHTASSGDTLVDEAVVDRAIDMARMLYDRLPDEPEVQGLLALLLLTDARKATRTSQQGELVLLADQDRTQWNLQEIVEGTQLVTAALTHRPAGRFALQAAIAGTHTQAPTYEETDWGQIVGLYDLLLVAWPSPVVALNRAVAVSMAEGPQRGLDELDQLSQDPELANYVYLAASRADLLRQLGRNDEAIAAYEQALRLVDNEIERDYLDKRLLEVGPTP